MTPHPGSQSSSASVAATSSWRFDRRLVALVNRLTQGFSLKEYKLATQLGHQGYVEHHLDHLAIDDSAIQPYLDSLVTLWMTTDELHEYSFTHQHAGAKMVVEMPAAHVYRAVNSKRQLYERVVEFWTDHFNVDIADSSCRMMKPTDDREVIRPHAFGTFHDLLNASAHSGAMLFYLDNYANFAHAPQENYGREIMELHSLGVGGGYTEEDVKEVSRCFTGWRFVPQQQEGFGEFVFDPAIHDSAEKTVVGHVIPAGGGESDGLAVIQILSEHPSTAQFVGRKLASWLVAHEPSQELVDEVAQTFQSSGGSVKEMLRVLLREDHFHAAQPWKTENKKLKRPFHFATSLMRAVSAEIQGHNALVYHLKGLGQPSYGCQQPTGWDDSFEAWGANLHPRWEFAHKLMTNQIPQVLVSPGYVSTLLEKAGTGSLAQRIDTALTGGQMSTHDVARVQAYFDAAGGDNWQALAEGIALAASSPSFQLY